MVSIREVNINTDVPAEVANYSLKEYRVFSAFTSSQTGMNIIPLAVTAVALVGSIVVWISPIRKNLVILKRFYMAFIAMFIYSIFIDLEQGGPTLQINPVLIFVLTILISRKELVARSQDPKLRRVDARRNLRSWYFMIGIVLAVATGALAYDFSNPGDLDRLNGNNDSATVTLGIAFVVLGILGTGARFSYLKYSRVNQADLIADAIKSHVQPPNSGPLGAPANPSPQTPPDVEDRLRKLTSLLADGLISNDDFETKKQQILDSL